MIFLEETGQSMNVDLVPTSVTPLAVSEGYAAQNPLNKVPALERPDGCTLYDSRVICRYLNDRAGADLYPRGPALWDVLTLEATGEGMIDAALLMAYEGRMRPEEFQFPDWIEGQWGKVGQALDALEARWMAHLHAPLNAGQIAVACALGYLDLRHADRNWRGGRSTLDSWFSEFSERPSFLGSSPPG